MLSCAHCKCANQLCLALYIFCHGNVDFRLSASGCLDIEPHPYMPKHTVCGTVLRKIWHFSFYDLHFTCLCAPEILLFSGLSSLLT